MREKVIDLFGNLGILTWFALSSWAFFEQGWESFQRLGAFGVAIAVLYFASVRLTAANPQPVGLPERLEWMSKIDLQSSLAARQALFNVSILAKALEADPEVQGRIIKTTASELAEPLKSATPPEWPEDSEVFEQLSRHRKDEERANDDVSRSIRSSDVLNAAIVSLGTLQSGFGDLVRIEVCPSC